MADPDGPMLTAVESQMIEDAHLEFVRAQVAKGVDGPVPPDRPPGSDYNQHVPDAEANGVDMDAFHSEVRAILGLAPL